MAVGDGASCAMARVVSYMDTQVSDQSLFVYGQLAAPFNTVMTGAATLVLMFQLAREMLVDGHIQWSDHIWRYALVVVAGALLTSPDAFFSSVFEPVKSFIFGVSSQATGSMTGASTIGGMICSSQEVVERSYIVAEKMWENSYMMGAVGFLVMAAWIVMGALYVLTVIIGLFMLYIPAMLGPAMLAAMPFQGSRRLTMSALDIWIGSAGYLFFAGIAIGIVSGSINDVFANTPGVDVAVPQARVDEWIRSGDWIAFAISPILAIGILVTTGRWVSQFSNRMEASVGGSARSAGGAAFSALRIR